MKKKKFNGIEYQIGSDNIFADLGIDNPEEALIKAQLTLEIAKIIKQQKLTQAKGSSNNNF